MLPIFLIVARFFVYPVRDTGAWVRAAFNDPDTWVNKDMRIVTEWLSSRDMASIASKVTGKNITNLELDQAGFEASKDLPWPGAEDIYFNFLFFVKVLSTEL
jgi:uncharacterized protein YbjT (DUF2867 family)